MAVKLLTEHHLEFLSLKGDCTGSYESTLAKMPHCWKSHVAAHIYRNGKFNMPHVSSLVMTGNYKIALRYKTQIYRFTHNSKVFS